MAKIVKRMKKDGTCSYCIRVSNGYDRQGRQVMVNRTFTPELNVFRVKASSLSGSLSGTGCVP